jgi:hypothetical protein
LLVEFGYLGSYHQHWRIADRNFSRNYNHNRRVWFDHAETDSTMTITPLSAGITANGTDTVNFTITGTTQSGQQDISSLITLTPEQSGTAVTGVVSCVATTDSDGNAVQQCSAAEGSIQSTEQYDMVVTYSGYTGTANVQATLTVSP